MPFGMMDYWGTAGMAHFWLFGIVWILAFIWVLVDSVGRKDLKDNQKIAWILIALISGLLGALVYYAASGRGARKKR